MLKAGIKQRDKWMEKCTMHGCVTTKKNELNISRTISQSNEQAQILSRDQ